MSTFPITHLLNSQPLLPQCLVLHGTWEVALVEFSWPGLIENVTEGLFSYQPNRDEQNRDTSTQETIVEGPRFVNGMVSLYAPRNMLKRNSSTLEEEFSPGKFFSITEGCYGSVNSILQSMCDNLCSSIGWDVSQFPLSWDICAESQLLHLQFSTTSSKQKKTIRPKAVSKDLKNILGLEYLVDSSQTNDDAKQPEGSHGLEVLLGCKKLWKSWKTRRNERANWWLSCWSNSRMSHYIYFTMIWFKTKHSETHKQHYSGPYHLVSTKDSKRSPELNGVEW